ncbi:N-acetylglucosamine-6-phosphate deacetylase [Halanaerobium sp. MA284_MarDTE_T2]|uniref:N-acetylglucosamine-6-phosphate deacetylase n=1 Tax=Halanaerobium sp. MA284_MarDTE_T2 TaxID=2183913 RepID=UPI000DF3D436|nr:N-acetylglucosamine-6-phosphate deacetylase [Halanaerobium sp. MA284_MarDTE_T2]
MCYYLTAKKILAESEILENYALLIKSEKIKKIVRKEDMKSDIKVKDLGNKIIIPGLIDLHIHGAAGYDVMDGDYDSIKEISNYLCKNGVTSFLATTLTAPLEKIENAVKTVELAKKNGLEGAKILGVYLEGPYLTEEHKGAHPVEFMREIKIEEIDKLLKKYGELIKVIALAPEKENALAAVEYLKEKGIKTAIAHTDASYEETKAAIEKGAVISTHTFNGMRGMHHREAGTAGAVMDSDKIFAELIADKIHVSPAVIRILYKLKGKEKLYLVSDCMRAGGLEDGQYKLGELSVKVEEGITRTESGSLAGSTLKMKDAVLNIKDAAEIDLFEAVKFATLVPAKAIGLQNNIGSISEGKNADLTVIDDNLNIYLTVVDGQIVYNSDI